MHTAIRLILKQAQGESESVNCWDDAASCIHFILEVNTQHVFRDAKVMKELSRQPRPVRDQAHPPMIHGTTLC